jgi:hypothetical protein
MWFSIDIFNDASMTNQMNSNHNVLQAKHSPSLNFLQCLLNLQTSSYSWHSNNV